MNKKNLFFVFIFLLSVFLTVIIGEFIAINESKKIVNNVYKFYNDENINLLYFGKKDCYFCQMFNPVLDEVSTDYNIKYIYFDIKKITNSDLKEILKLLNISEKDFGTPTLSIVGNGTSYNQIGYYDKENLFQFLKSGGVISKEELNPYTSESIKEE